MLACSTNSILNPADVWLHTVMLIEWLTIAKYGKAVSLYPATFEPVVVQQAG